MECLVVSYKALLLNWRLAARVMKVKNPAAT
jgi:hypothetical protein